MRTSIYLFFIFFFSYSAKGNDTLSYLINGADLSRIDVPYVEATLCIKPFTTRYYIDIDYGQETKFFNFRDRRLTDKHGNYIEFNSRIAAIHFLVNQGYDIFDHQYLFDGDGDLSGQRLLLKKQKPTYQID